MMTSNTLPTGAILSAINQNGGSIPKIPFENSKTMDECRIQVLRKFRKEIIDTVRFSDVSATLIACRLVSKEECYEICKLSVPKQMLQCYQKVHDIMDILVCQKTMASTASSSLSKSSSASAMEEKQKGLVKELWNNFIASLRKEHFQLATKMENELDKITENRLLLKRNNSGSKLRKEDIGAPTAFMHVQHYGLIRSKSEPMVVRLPPESAQISQIKLELQALKEEITKLSSMIIDDNDPDLKEFFKRAGVAPRHLADPIIKQIILKFIVENGGMNAVREEIRQTSIHLPKDNQDGKADSVPDMIKVKENKDDKDKDIPSPQPQPQPLPANVPFEPTPRPTLQNLFYF